jgi:hypothetical protein
MTRPVADVPFGPVEKHRITCQKNNKSKAGYCESLWAESRKSGLDFVQCHQNKNLHGIVFVQFMDYNNSVTTVYRTGEKVRF